MIDSASIMLITLGTLSLGVSLLHYRISSRNLKVNSEANEKSFF